MRRIFSLIFASALTIGGLGLLAWQVLGPGAWWAMGRMIGIGLFFTALGVVWLWSDYISPRSHRGGDPNDRASTPATAWMPQMSGSKTHVWQIAVLTAFFTLCFALAAWKQVPLGMALMGLIAVGFGGWLLQLVNGKKI